MYLPKLIRSLICQVPYPAFGSDQYLLFQKKMRKLIMHLNNGAVMYLRGNIPF